MASADVRLGQGAEGRFAVPLNLRPKLFWQLDQTPQSIRIIELPQEPLVLVGEPHGRDRHLADEPLKFGKNRGVHLDPFARDLKEHAAELVIETVVALRPPFHSRRRRMLFEVDRR